MGFAVLFVLLIATAAWWLRSRWSAVRDAQAARREAELLMIFEARSKMQAEPVATQAPSDFTATLPGLAAVPKRSAASGSKGQRSQETGS
jgi:hypothetical protein